MRKQLLAVFILVWCNCLVHAQVQYGGRVVDESGDGIVAAQLISLKTMESWWTDLNGYYELIADEDIEITVQYVGYKRYDNVIKPQDVIVLKMFEDCGVCQRPWVGHFLHFISPFHSSGESRTDFLRKKLDWHELKSFGSRYTGKEFHSYQRSGKEVVSYNEGKRKIRIFKENIPIGHKLLLYSFQTNSVTEYKDVIKLKGLPVGWYELYVVKREKDRKSLSQDLAIGVIKVIS